MPSTEVRPKLSKIRRNNGVAGQIAYSVRVDYPSEMPKTVVFIGSVYGGPVVMQTAADPIGTFVTDPNRFGKFSPRWVRAFFGVK